MCICAGMRQGEVCVWGDGQFNVRGPDFPRASVVNSVHYSTVYLKRGLELLQ